MAANLNLDKNTGYDSGVFLLIGFSSDWIAINMARFRLEAYDYRCPVFCGHLIGAAWFVLKIIGERVRNLIGLILLTVVSVSSAQNLAMVSQLQQPTWVERDGNRSPLYPGGELRAGDLVVTGSTGKLLLRFAEGSDVEVGSGATLRLQQLSLELVESQSLPVEAANSADRSEMMFRGLMDVLRGAFRFTTTAAGLGKPRSIDISVGQMATIGIRGTDVWGKADPDGDFVVLIEGTISVDRQGKPTLQMEDPQTIYRAPADQQATVNKVDGEDLQRWAKETALTAGDGVLSEQGRYGVSLASMQRDDYARFSHARFRRLGYAATLQPIEINNQNWQRVAVQGFVNKADAETFSSQLMKKHPDVKPWVFLVR